MFNKKTRSLTQTGLFCERRVGVVDFVSLLRQMIDVAKGERNGAFYISELNRTIYLSEGEWPKR